MSGSIHYGSDRRCTVAAAMGFATVLAVAGAVGCSTALYKASVVHPATGLTGTIPLSQLSGVKTSVPSVTPLVPRSLPNAVRSSDTPQGSPGFWPTAVVLTGVAAFIALYFQRNQERPLTAKPISMAAASGERLLWYPGAEPPEYLTGEYPGDRGFDPLGLSKDPDTFERMRIAEVFHCRLAMLGAVGCLVPELVFHRASWQDALEGADLNKVGAIAMQVIAPLEYWRGNGGFSWDGLDAGDRSYPGFDPLKLTTDETKLKEIKNGRLAMIAMLGFAVQNAVTGTGPLQNLAAVTGSVAMFASTGHKDGLWFPDATPPDHLTGEFPGDRGFDPLSLAADPETYKRMRIAEVFHCRLAMLGVVGVLIPEFLGKGVWYEVGDASKALPNGFLFMCLCAPLEYWRGQGGFGWNKGDSDRSYPGFDPAKLTTEYTKVAEIKNGRLAMTAMLGFEVQHHLTGASPLANLAAHLADPLKVNITSLPSIAMF